MNKITSILTLGIAALAAAPVAEARHHDGGGYSERGGGGCSRRYVEYCRSCGGPAYIETYVAYYSDCGDPVYRTRVIPVEVCRPAPVYCAPPVVVRDCPPPVVVRDRDCGPRITVQFGGWR